jgi:hypothetical protein
MFKSSCLVLFGALIAFAGCGGGDSSSPAEGCMKNCAIVAQVKCKNDNAATCQSKCEDMAKALPQCQSQISSLLACTNSHPASDWECDDTDGTANVKGEFCNAEGFAVLGCALGGK